MLSLTKYNRLNWFAVLVISLLFMAACGNGGSNVDPDPTPGPGDTQVPEGLWEGTVAANSGGNPGYAGVPEIPLDGAHSASVVTTQQRLGSEFIQKHNAEVDGTTLVMAAPPGEVEDGPIAYGMYSFSGLQDVTLQYLNVECMPREFGEEYYVLLADFTNGDWLWFGPVALPEFQLDLSDLNHRFITELGNMYIMVLCGAGNGATLSRSVLTFDGAAGGGGDGTLPGVPRHLEATDGTYEIKVVIEWVRGEGADYTELWRVVGDGQDWQKIGEPDGNRFEDTDVEPGVVYWYKARSVNEHGHSEFGNHDSGYAGEGGGEGHIPGVPLHLVATDGTYEDKVVIEWTRGEGADYTELWRLAGEGSEWQKIGEPDGNRFEDREVEPGVVYLYKARSVNEHGHSEFGNHDSGYAGEGGGGGPGRPFELVASDGTYGDKVRIEWGMEGDYHHFLLYRKLDGEEHEWDLIGDPVHPEYNDFNVEPGVVYWYKVIAVLNEQQSEPSNHDSGYAGDNGGGPGQPFELVASDGTYPDKVRLEWSIEGGYHHFLVYRKLDGEGHEWILRGDPVDLGFNDFDVEPGVVYWYKVIAVLNEQQSEPSNHDSGYAGEGGGGGPGRPFELVASDGTYEDKVRLEWGIEGDYHHFLVYRKLDGEEHEWDLIGDPVHTEFNDINVEPGVVYWYKVIAVLNNQQSEPSNHDSGYAGEGGGGGPGQPFELFATDGTYPDKVRLEWSIEGDYHHFLVYRKLDGEGNEWILRGDPVTTEFNDFEVEPGVVYWYKVIAVLNEQQSEPSNHDSGYAGEGGGGGPGRPFELFASDGTYHDKVRVEWGMEGDYHHFLLYRKLDGEEHEWDLIGDPGIPEFNDFNVEPGVVYWYKVIAVLNEQQSEPSNQDSGYAGENGGGPGQPFELVASDGTYHDKVRVEWSIEGDYHHFLLYRRLSGEEQEWTLRGEPEITEFNDFEVEPDVVYWYKVIAVLNEQQSEPSNHDSGYAAGGD